MHPQIHVGYAAIGGAVIASFLFGWLWHGPLFGKKWAALMGMPPMTEDCKPDPKVMLRGMGLQIVGTFLTAYVLTHSIQVWHASVWGAGADGPFYVYGFFGGFFTWLGFYVPMLLATVAWEQRKWSLFMLNAAYHFINLQLIGMILSRWG